MGSPQRNRQLTNELQQRRQALNNCFHARALVQHRAQLLVKREPRKPAAKAGKVVAQIIAHKITGIRKARPNHMLVALHHLRQVCGISVAHTHKKRQQPARPPNRKVALMFLHHRHQHFLRQLQIRFLERTQKCGRTLDKIGNLGQQPGIRRNRAVHLCSQLLRLLHDCAGARFMFKNNSVRPHALAVTVGRANLNHFTARRRIRAQRTRSAARLQAAPLKGQRLRINHCRKPAHRPGKRRRSAPRPPAHALLKLKRCKDARRQFCQHHSQRLACGAHQRHHVLAAVHAAPLQRTHRHALAARKTLRRRRGLPRSIKRIAHRRPARHRLRIRLQRRQPSNAHRQAARRSVHNNRTMRQPFRQQQLRQQQLQLRDRAVHICSGQLLRANLKQKGGRRFCERQLRGRPGCRLGAIHQQRVAQLCALRAPRFRYLPRQVAHALKKLRALGDAHRAARIQHIERM